MKSIKFNTGIKKYMINDDENNVISININDVNLLKRIKEAPDAFDNILARLDTEENTPELLSEVDEALKKELDRIFGTDISAHAFGDVNCLSPLEDGNLLFMAFFEVFAPAIIEDLNANNAGFKANRDEKFAQYLPKDKEKAPAKPTTFDDLKFTKEQLEFLRSMSEK